MNCLELSQEKISSLLNFLLGWLMEINGLIIKIKPVIQEAGDILITYFNKFNCNIGNTKIINGQYVTDADIKSEEFLKKRLGEIVPQASFIAEESGKSGDNEFCFVIDPLDGTTNFAHGIPYFCISVALTVSDEPVLGFVFDPNRNDFFFAQKGKGAFLNGNKINVSNKQNLSECFFATNIPCGTKIQYGRQWEKLTQIRNECFAMRLMGACALDLANVASGRFDGAFFHKLKWWDIAAGTLLIREAGGIVTDFNGQVIDPSYKSYIAANKHIHNNLIKFLI